MDNKDVLIVPLSTHVKTCIVQLIIHVNMCEICKDNMYVFQSKQDDIAILSDSITSERLFDPKADVLQYEIKLGKVVAEIIFEVTKYHNIFGRPALYPDIEGHMSDS